jgi:GntR family transcriptional regulator, transcriptional repressor for pyruvate dehydrogenase complex
MIKKKKSPGASAARGSSFLTPVTRTTLTADVCRKMVTHLIRGDWSVGERIPPERELCLQLGVGRASLREALKALEIMGMIETRLGDGTYVCPRSEFLSRPLLWAITGSALSEAHELVEARCLIEMGTAAFAAERATPEDLKEIGNYLDRMEASLNDLTAFEEADIGFHLAVGRAAHNQILHNALLLIRNLMQKWIDEALRQPGVASKALDQHKQIFLAIAKRNPELTKAAMRQHLDVMARHFQEAQDGAAASMNDAVVIEE